MTRCSTTHHTGCACHEARRDEEVATLRAEVERLRADLAAEQQRSAGLRLMLADSQSELADVCAKWARYFAERAEQNAVGVAVSGSQCGHQDPNTTSSNARENEAR